MIGHLCFRKEWERREEEGGHIRLKSSLEKKSVVRMLFCFLVVVVVVLRMCETMELRGLKAGPMKAPTGPSRACIFYDQVIIGNTLLMQGEGILTQ